ncbi:MAG: DUF4838 domain-containing protein [Opitutales bacterium]
MLLLVSVLLPSLEANRAAFWKPERPLGSARLAVDSIRWLVLPADADARLVEAGHDLAEVMRASGVALKVVEGGAVLPKHSIVVRGPNNMGREQGGGFSIRCQRSRVFVRSSSMDGLSNGLYAIAHDVFGARWYWPGELGFELLPAAADKFPAGPRLESPGFVQRTLHPVETDFGRRNRLNRRFAFNHNLARIFTEAVYEDHPEVFAAIEGKRRRPRKSPKLDPQPDFTNAITVDLAAEAALEHFRTSPEATSFSLSINDNILYDEGAATEAMVSPLSYFRGRPNYTDLVFRFMNEVAERVFRVPGMLQTPSGQDRYLTALAYYWAEQSPSFELHPRVMPVLTSDRAQWHDPNYRSEDRALIERWVHSGAERIATWDYYFGAPYPYPRQFKQWMVESIRYLHGQGVDVFFSQLPSVWGLDGPKAWLAAQLLWDPEADAHQLLDEFYTHFFGLAAEPIRQFYEIAERTRNERAGQANWIKFYKDEAGVGLFDAETLALMRSCISEAERLVAVDDRRSARVRIISEAFSFTEAYFELHQSRDQLVRLSLKYLNSERSHDAGQLLGRLRSYRTKQLAFEELKGRLIQDPMHRGLAYFKGFKQSAPDALVRAALARSEWTAEHTDEKDAFMQGLEAWRLAGDEFRSIVDNPHLVHQGLERRNFLGPEIPIVGGWAIDYRANEGFALTGAEGLEARGLRIMNADIVRLKASFPVIAGKAYRLKLDAAWQVSPDNRTWLQFKWKSASGEELQNEVALRLPNGSSRGVQRLEFALIPPMSAYDLKVGILINRQYPGDFLELRTADFGVIVPKR